MEPNQNQGQTQEPVEGPMPEQNAFAQESVAEKKTGNGMLIGMILCALIALGGVGFGIWAMMDGNTQKEQLNSQISTLKNQNKELKDKIDSGIGGDEVIVDINTETNTVADAKDYIFVGNWGLKIRIPETMETATYSFDYGDGYTVLRVSGVTKDSGQDLPDFAKIAKCVLGVVERYSKANVEAGVVPSWYGEPFMSNDGFNYYYSSPQEVCTNVQEFQQRETNTVNEIKSMLTATANYSKI